MAKVMVRVNKSDDPPTKIVMAGHEDTPLYMPDNANIRINDTRSVNPTTGLSLGDRERKSINADPTLIKNIIAHAKAKGIDPATALAISYQETGLNKDAPFNLNPDYYGKPTGDPQFGIETIQKQMEYAKNLQKKGFVPNTEEYLLQGYNGYGRINKGHADLEGANKIYGYPIPEGGIDLKANPLYGKTVISLRELIKNHPQIKSLIENTPAYQNQVKVRVKKP
jgi:hypothetical protein